MRGRLVDRLAIPELCSNNSNERSGVPVVETDLCNQLLSLQRSKLQ